MSTIVTPAAKQMPYKAMSPQQPSTIPTTLLSNGQQKSPSIDGTTFSLGRLQPPSPLTGDRATLSGLVQGRGSRWTALAIRINHSDSSWATAVLVAIVTWYMALGTANGGTPTTAAGPL
jgi:hypothetical protein